MKTFIIIISLLLFNIEGKSQKISTYSIWSALYPNNQKFDSKNRLIRKIIREGYDIEFRTEIEKIFYYKVGHTKKAIVILYSYRYDTANDVIDFCHLCFPEFEMAYFSCINKNWVKNKFIQNWEGSTGSWGKGAALEMKDYNNVKCLVLKSRDGYQGVFYEFTTYYNIETLKLIKSLNKEYSP